MCASWKLSHTSIRVLSVTGSASINIFAKRRRPHASRVGQFEERQVKARVTATAMPALYRSGAEVHLYLCLAADGRCIDRASRVSRRARVLGGACFAPPGATGTVPYRRLRPPAPRRSGTAQAPLPQSPHHTHTNSPNQNATSLRNAPSLRMTTNSIPNNCLLRIQ